MERLIDLHLEHMISRDLSKLSARILDNLDCLTLKYSEMLTCVPAYAATPSSLREIIVRNFLQSLAQSLSKGCVSLFTESFWEICGGGLRRGVSLGEIEWALCLLPVFLRDIRADPETTIAVWRCVTNVVSEIRRSQELVPA